MNEAAFLAAIRDDPDDDLPRLAYADWLDEQGRGERAEFIRVQIELSHGVRDAGVSVGLLRRGRELLAEYRKAWMGGRLYRWALDAQFERGFITSITLPATTFFQYGGSILERHPITRLSLQTVGGHIAELATCPHLEGIHVLNLDGQGLGDAGAAALAHSPYLARLRVLRVSLNRLGRPGVHALVTSTRLNGLTDLRFGGNLMGDSPVITLSNTLAQPRLQRLDLSANNLGSPSARALAECTRLGTLRALRLTNNRFRRADIELLARSQHLANVQIIEVTSYELNANTAAELRREFGPRLVC